MTGVDDVEIKKSSIAGAGNGVFAKKDFEPGDIVLSVSRPYITELDMERLEDSCAWCCSRAALDPTERVKSRQMGLPAGFVEVKACTGCQKIKYCSKSCQAKHWKEHKYECKVLAPADRPPLPHGVRATLKLLKKIQAGDEAPKGILLLDSKLDEVKQSDPEVYEEYSTMAWGAWNFAEKPSKADVGVARHLFFAVNCNALTLSSPLDDANIGIGFDPLICTVNHSCDPNVFFIFNCPRTLLRARKPIKSGEEIFTRYRDTTNPFTVRQGDLKDGYYFTCTCSKCAKGPELSEDKFARPIDTLDPAWSSKADAMLRDPEAERIDFSWYKVGDNGEVAERRMTAMQAEAFRPWAAMKGLRHQFHGQVPRIELSDLREALRLCLESGMWSLQRQPVPHLLRGMFGAYMAQGEIEKCLKVGMKKHFLVDPLLHPEAFDYERVIDSYALMNVATAFSTPAKQVEAEKLGKEGCDTRMLFLGLLAEIWDALPKSYGIDSPLGQVVSLVWKTCVGDMQAVPRELTKQKRTAWPALKAYAEQIDLMKL